jgi:transposase
MNRRTRPTYSSIFRLEAPQLLVNQGLSIREAAEAIGLTQLRGEHDGISPQAIPMAPDQ